MPTDTLVTVVANRQPVITIVSRLHPEIAVAASVATPPPRMVIDWFRYGDTDVRPSRTPLGDVAVIFNGAITDDTVVQLMSIWDSTDKIALMYLTL